MSAKQGRNIAIVGGSGTIGTHIVAGLLDQGVHNITAISRTESDSTFPAGVKVCKGNYTDKAFVLSALEGQDVLVLALGYLVSSLQTPLIKAAAKAGVRWVVPNELGSDPYASQLLAASLVLVAKKTYRDLIEEVGLSWIASVNNPWFDWSLEGGHWGFDIRNLVASLYDGGNSKFITTTVESAGRGVAGVLTLPDAELACYKNAPVYLSSFRVSQRDILRVASPCDGDRGEGLDSPAPRCGRGDHRVQGRDAEGQLPGRHPGLLHSAYAGGSRG